MTKMGEGHDKDGRRSGQRWEKVMTKMGEGHEKDWRRS